MTTLTIMMFVVALGEPASVLVVIADEAGQPVPGAEAWWTPSEDVNTPAERLVRDDDGVLRSRPLGWLRVSAADFFPWEGSVGKEIVLRRAGVVTLRVMDSVSSLPVQGARVTVSREEEEGMLTTGLTAEDGRWQSKRVPPGVVRISVEGSGYLRTEILLRADVPSAGRPERLVRLAPTQKLQVKVVAGEMPIAGALVAVLQEDPGDLIPMTSDGEGLATLALPLRRQRNPVVLIADPASQRWTVLVLDRESDQGHLDSRLLDRQVDLTALGEIAGHVRYRREDAGAAGLRVEAWPLTLGSGTERQGSDLGPALTQLLGRSPTWTETDVDGAYRFQLPPGSWFVVVRPSETASQSAERAVRVETGQESRADVLLESLRSVAGYVQTSGGLPLEGAKITAVNGYHGQELEALSDAAGAFTLSRLVARRVELTITLAGYITSVTKVGWKQRAVEVTLERGSRVVGQVVGAETSAALSDFEVQVLEHYPGLGLRRTGPHQEPKQFTSIDGRFSIEGVPPGTWAVAATMPGRSVGFSTPFIVEEGVEEIDTGTIELSRGIRLSGRIVDEATGSAVTGARVRVDTDPNLPALATYSDASGEYVLEGLDEGLQSLEIKHEAYPPQRPERLRLLEDAQLDFELRHGGTASGHATLPSGEPLAERTVELATPDGRRLNAHPRTRTDGAGAFAFDQVAAGEYLFRLIGQPSAGVLGTVEPGSTTEIDLVATGGLLTLDLRAEEQVHESHVTIHLADGRMELTRGGSRVQLAGIPKGEHSLDVSALVGDIPGERRWLERRGLSVSIDPGRAGEQLTITLQDADQELSEVFVEVHWPVEAPALAGWTLTATSEERRQAMGVFESASLSHFTLPSGRHTIALVAPSSQSEWRGSECTGTLVDGEFSPGCTLRPQRLDRVRVTVLSVSGAPVRDAQVLIVPEGTSIAGRGRQVEFDGSVALACETSRGVIVASSSRSGLGWSRPIRCDSSDATIVVSGESTLLLETDRTDISLVLGAGPGAARIGLLSPLLGNLVEREATAIRVLGLPAGRATLSVSDGRAIAVDLRAGETERLEIP